MLLPSVLTSSRLICAAGLALTLAACGGTGEDLSAVRTGPQAVHPGSTVARAPAPSARKPQAPAAANLRESLFQEFCLAHASAAASETALRASGRFAAPVINQFGGARYASYQLLGTSERASVSVTTGAAANIQCSVGVNNVGSTLYEGGRISRQ